MSLNIPTPDPNNDYNNNNNTLPDTQFGIPLTYSIAETADSFQAIICPCETTKIEDFRGDIKFGMCQDYVGKIIYPKSKYTREQVEEIIRTKLPYCKRCEDTNISCQKILGEEKKFDVLSLIGGNIIGVTTPAVLSKTVDPHVNLPLGIQLSDILSFGGGLIAGLAVMFSERLKISGRTQRFLATVGTVLVASNSIRKVVK